MMPSIDEILFLARTGRPIVMGILNVTPDSFSDGGEYLDPSAACDRANSLAAAGADIIDIGAESTRPGSNRVSADEQIARLRPVLPAAVATGIPVSIDTTLAAVAQFAIDSGATMLNDISAGRDDPAMLPLAARHGAPIVLMHMLGEPKSMQAAPHYTDVLVEVIRFLRERIDAAIAAGVAPDRVVIDPGIGFGKSAEHNLALLAGANKLVALGCPVLVGPSRKRFIGQLTNQPDPAKRIAGTIVACLAAWQRGATVFRVHDVAEVKSAFAVAAAIAAKEEA